MYTDKEQQLREKELQRTVKQYLQGRRERENPEGDYKFIETCPYDELPCSEEEKAALCAIAEGRLPDLEAEIPRFIRYNASFRTVHVGTVQTTKALARDLCGL